MLQTSVFPNYTNTPNKATEEQNRTLCLYRVSSAGQLYHTEENDADIPMQRLECRRFAERMGWNIVYEFQEEGVSGHKVRAENRDKIQKVKELAKQKKFDIDNEKAFFTMIKGAFSQRRKTLVNSLSSTAGISKDKITSALGELGISPTVRAEKMGMEDFVSLYGLLY